MSVVTNLLLHIGFLEDGNEICMAQVADFFETQGHKPPINVTDRSLPSNWYGSNGKSFEAELYIGANNRFSLEDFEQHIRQIPWVNPQVVQIIVKEQEDEIFRVVNIGEVRE